MILKGTVVFVALPLALFVFAVRPPLGGSPKASELRLQSYDSRLQGGVYQALCGAAVAVVVMDAESAGIHAQTVSPMELLGSGKLDRQQRLVCQRPLRVGGT